MNKSSKLTKTDVIHVAKLAKLKLTPSEVKKFQQQLSAILNYMEILGEVKTVKIEPTSQITGLKNVTRKDEVRQSLTQRQALSNAQSSERGYFKIKAILA